MGAADRLELAVPDPQAKGLDVVAEFQRSLRELDQAHCLRWRIRLAGRCLHSRFKVGGPNFQSN